MIHFRDITEDNYEECINLCVDEHQINFVGSNVSSLAKAYIYGKKVRPFGIYNDNTMVGFLLLRYNHDFNNCFLWELMIDRNYQSKGYGKAAITLLIDWVKNNTDCSAITTTYKTDNYWAGNLYKSSGFKYLDSCPEHNEEDLILHIK